jgi:hypothetical protein
MVRLFMPHHLAQDSPEEKQEIKTVATQSIQRF